MLSAVGQAQSEQQNRTGTQLLFRGWEKRAPGMLLRSFTWLMYSAGGEVRFGRYIFCHAVLKLDNDVRFPLTLFSKLRTRRENVSRIRTAWNR